MLRWARNLFIFGTFMLAVCPGLFAGTITSATVYPVGATVTIEDEAAAGTVSLRLPYGSDPDSLAIKVADERFRIQDVSLTQVSRTGSPEVLKLKTRLQELTAQHQQAAAALEACEAEQGFWKGALDRDWSSAVEALKLNDAARLTLPRLIRQRQDFKIKVADLEKAIKDLQHEIDQLGGGSDQDWSVQVQLIGPKDARTKLALECYVSQCGYEPSYRLNALPAKNQIEFGYEARVWQKTGSDWNGVRLKLASLRPSSAVNPPELDPWVVYVRQNLMRAGAMSYKAMPAAAPVAVMEEAASDAAMVVEEQRGTYTEWQVGSVSLPTGPGRLIKISGETWPAEFVYRLRPEQGAQGFLEAAIDLGEGRQLPRGDALYFVEGAMVGRLPFDLAASSSKIYFGTDSLVRCDRKLVDQKTGSKGLVKSSQTYAWHYELKVSNLRRNAVKVLVEEAKPQARDESIRVNLKATPDFSSQDEVKGVWELELAPQTVRKLDYEVKLESPLDLDPGR